MIVFDLVNGRWQAVAVAPVGQDDYDLPGVLFHHSPVSMTARLPEADDRIVNVSVRSGDGNQVTFHFDGKTLSRQ